MTSLTLLLWISAALILQLAAWVCVGFWWQWRAYRALLRLAVAQGIAVDALADADLPQTPPTAPPAWPGYRNFRLERKEQEDAAGQVFSFYLAPQDKSPLPAFLPGQFLTFALDLPGALGATESVVRCYSLSDAPQPGHYRITVKRAAAPANSAYAAGLASSHLHDHVAVGDILRVRAPGGRFYLERSDAPVVLIGGGVGITPLLSMLNWCLAEQPKRELWLFYGVRHGEELVMPAHLQAMAVQHPNLHLHLCLSEPQATPPDGAVSHRSGPVHYHHGRVDIALLRRLLPLKPYHFYICGPTPMLESLVPALEDWGVPEQRIHFEAFGPASIPRKKSLAALPACDDADPAPLVRFSKSNKQMPWDSGMGSLLDFAQAQGVAVDSGCRAGSCGSCQTAIVSGEVRYLHPPDFTPEPGTCLLCVCTPKTDVTLEA